MSEENIDTHEDSQEETPEVEEPKEETPKITKKVKSGTEPKGNMESTLVTMSENGKRKKEASKGKKK